MSRHGHIQPDSIDRWKKDKEDGWMGKVVVYVYIGTMCFTQQNAINHKMNDSLPFLKAWMDLKGIMLCEISATEREI